MSWFWLIPAFVAGFYLGFITFALLSSNRIADDWTEEQEMQQHNDYHRRSQ